MSDSAQPAAGKLFVAVSVATGAVSRTERAPNDSWSKFAPVFTPTRPAERAAQVSALFEKVGFTTASVPPRLFFTRPDGSGGWQPPILLATGMAPADLTSAQQGVDTFALHTAGIGAPSLPNWVSGLPTQTLSQLVPRPRTLTPGGDLLATADTGKMDPADALVGLGTAWPEVCVVTAAGRLFFNQDASSRHLFEDVKALAGDPGSIIQASCSGPHLVAVTSDGVIHHTIREPNGKYTAFENVNAKAGAKLAFTQAAVASFNAGANLHLVATTGEGGLFYSQWHRGVDRPGWSPFEDVKAKAGDPGAVTSVAIAL